MTAISIDDAVGGGGGRGIAEDGEVGRVVFLDHLVRGDGVVGGILSV